MFEDALKNINKVYFSPDGAYNKINVSTLMKPDGSYIIDSKEVINVANTYDIISLKESNQTTKRLLNNCYF